jgi:hypothetical protein
LTPKGDAAANRSNLVRKQLSKSDTVTSAIYDAGYNSNSRFYETSNQLFGMTPSNYRASGRQTDIRFAVCESSLGSILVAQSGRGIFAIFLGDDPDSLVRVLQDQFPEALIAADAGFELVARVVGFVQSPALGIDLPLEIRAPPSSSASGIRCETFRQARPLVTRMWLGEIFATIDPKDAFEIARQIVSQVISLANYSTIARS